MGLDDWANFSWWEKYSKQDTLLNLRKDLPTPKDILLSAPLMQDSIKSSWKKEVSFFIDFFHIENYIQFDEKVRQLQWEFWITQDWIIWGETLKKIYINYYSKEVNLPLEIQYRLNIYKEIQENYNWPKKTSDGRLVLPTGIPKVFSKQTYYSQFWEWPKIWTFIEEVLFKKLPQQIGEKWNVIKISKIDINWEDKNYLAFYKNWKLAIATFISLGVNDKKRKTSEETYNISQVIRDIDHVSSEFPEEKKDKNWHVIVPKWWSAMAYAIHINWWTWIHSSNEIDGDPHSHGCIRIPLYYLKKLYSEVEWKPLKGRDKKLILKNIFWLSFCLSLK
jgi:hypothetical protein